MARRRKNSHHSKGTSHRVARRLQPFANFVATPQLRLSFDYSPWIDDRRRTAPTVVRRFQPLHTVDAAPASVKDTFKNGRHVLLPRYPEQHLLLCARRSVRKEVLFAIGKTGKGSRSPRARNLTSSISCR